MSHRLRSAALVFVAATVSALVATPAHATENPVEVVVDGLTGPFGLTVDGGEFFVTESGAGQVTGLVPGETTTVELTGLPGATGVDRKFGSTYVLTGESGGPPEDGAEPTPGGTTLYVSHWGGPPRALVDLSEYELAANPDGQEQFDDDGVPYDTLSNPVAVLAAKPWWDSRLFVADGGGNDVLVVDAWTGEVSTFFVPPTISTGACADAEQLNPGTVGCDSVPTGLAWGPDGNLYVSTLQSDMPGEGRVYVLDPCDGTVVAEIPGFTAPTGVAVGDDGTLYVSEVFAGFTPESDPATVGRIVAVDPMGERSAAAVTQPVGLEFAGGELYSTAFSVMAPPGAGQVVRVGAEAFEPLS
jgi:hypothetical protein